MWFEKRIQSAVPFGGADLAIITLALAVVLVYLPVRNYDFIRYDDEKYVTENPQVLRGLTADGVLWAFKTTEIGFWQPLPWLSHMVDVEAFGLKAGAHHMVNVLFHAVNAVLLFLALSALTLPVWRSAFVAALFAFHPMHVESVAWIAERKDVLSGFFWALALWTYAGYVRSPRPGRYMALMCCFILGLMSKPMVVTLPVVLLLLDYWPLGRFSDRGLRALVLEKLPMFIVGAASGLVTFFTETAGRVIQTAPLPSRLINAVVSYALYVEKMFYPARLSIIYPKAAETAPVYIVGSVLLIAAVSVWAVLGRRRYPYLFTGWFWFLAVMLPSIGIVKFGALEFQAMADRYTYVPYVGLFMAIAMALPSATPLRKGISAASSVLLLAACIAASSEQLRCWRDTVTLFSHAVAVTDRNYVAYNNLGTALAIKGLEDDAYTAFETAVRISPFYKTAYVNMGNILMQKKKPDEAIKYYEKAVSIDAQLPGAYLGIGVALLSMDKRREAVGYFQRALAIDPNLQAARHYLNEAVKINP
ncbi:MAG: tetratricopeptide repeat protein [Candidatus Magnetominusculus sp. LBB02]|nr:tetratricopeptide repeat protein [Candidatus Magnetominusculus sp. LBB02]